MNTINGSAVVGAGTAIPADWLHGVHPTGTHGKIDNLMPEPTIYRSLAHRCGGLKRLTPISGHYGRPVVSKEVRELIRTMVQLVIRETAVTCDDCDFFRRPRCLLFDKRIDGFV